MKTKFFTLLLAMTFFATTKISAYTVYYYNLQNYKYAVWSWGTGSSGYWSDWMSPVDDHEGWYKTTIPDNRRNVIFAAFPTSTESPNWSYKVSQTDDLLYDGVNAYYMNNKWINYPTYNGTCGENLTWSINTFECTLNIVGSGEMTNWEWNEETQSHDRAPWDSLRVYIKNINLPNGLTHIGENAFSSCHYITSVVVPNSVTSIGSSAFSTCAKLQSVVIGDGVIDIESHAFFDCFHLSSVVLGNNIKNIGNSVFMHCSSLTAIEIPASVVSIGFGTFAYCSNLASISFLGENPASIEYDTFEDSNPIIYVPCGTMHDYQVAWRAYFQNLNIQYYMAQPLSYTIEGKVNIEEAGYVITPLYSCGGEVAPDTVIVAKSNDGFHFVQWSDGITDNPRKIELTKDTSFTAEFAFETIGNCGDENLLTWTYEPNSKTLTISGEGTLNSNYSYVGAATLMQKLVIENGVTSIGDDAFINRTNLIEVIIPQSLQSTGKWPFQGCENIESVVWNATNCSTYDDGQFVYPPFLNCNKITSFTIGDNVQSLPRGLCFGLPISSIDIPNSVTSIGTSAFRECANLTSVTIGNSVTSIGDYAFFKCSGLTNVTIPNSVTSIGKRVFNNCTGLTSIEIPNSVTSIGEYAFCGCSSLTSIEIPNSVTNIETAVFAACSGLTSATIGNSVRSIGNYAFCLCSGLTSIEIPNSVTNIEYGAFGGCSSLTNIEIPNSVISLGECAFQECSRLTTLSLGENITIYGDSVFDGCSALSKIYNYRAHPAELGNGVFNRVDQFDCVLYVLEGSINLYKSRESDWIYFYFIEPMASTENKYTFTYVAKDNVTLDSEMVKLHLPDAPIIDGFTFVKWIAMSDNIEEGITIQAVYEAEEPTSAPEVYTNPANPTQKLIRNGNVYILTGDKTYTVTGQEVK